MTDHKAHLRTRREVNDFGIVVVMISYIDGLALLYTVRDDFVYNNKLEGETDTTNITLRIRPQVIVSLQNHYIKITTRTKLIKYSIYSTIRWTETLTKKKLIQSCQYFRRPGMQTIYSLSFSSEHQS